VQLYSSLQGIAYAGGHHSTKNIQGLPAFGPDMAKVLAVVALHHKARLSSVKLYPDDNKFMAIQLECLLRFYVPC
jgi:hypothetical protein